MSAVEKHVHEPMMAVITCMCGSRAVLLADGRLEAADHNWAALDKFYAKKHEAEQGEAKGTHE